MANDLTALRRRMAQAPSQLRVFTLLEHGEDVYIEDIFKELRGYVLSDRRKMQQGIGGTISYINRQRLHGTGYTIRPGKARFTYRLYAPQF